MKKLEEKPIIAPAIETTNILLILHRALLLRLLNGSLAIISFCCGAVVLASAALPIDRSMLIPDLSRHALTVLNGLSISFGLILLIVPLELYKRTRRSLYMTLTALAFAFVFSFLKVLISARYLSFLSCSSCSFCCAGNLRESGLSTHLHKWHGRGLSIFSPF